MINKIFQQNECEWSARIQCFIFVYGYNYIYFSFIFISSSFWCQCAVAYGKNVISFSPKYRKHTENETVWCRTQQTSPKVFIILWLMRPLSMVLSIRVCVMHCGDGVTQAFTNTASNLSWQTSQQFFLFFFSIFSVTRKCNQRIQWKNFGSIWMHCKSVKDPNSMKTTTFVVVFLRRGPTFLYLFVWTAVSVYIYFSLSSEFSNDFVDVIQDLCVYRRLA